ncbi:shortchain dehydrogenase/reductase SDR, putative, partial [Acanthamoeba castellanii str. Neff]
WSSSSNADVFGAREGASVAFTGRRAELGTELATRLGGAEAGTVVFIVADHARPEDCARCVKETLDAFGRIDILFNNAGVVLLDRTAEQTSEDEWDQVMRLNVTGVWRMCKEVLPVMRSQGAGSIINNASDWGLVGGRDAVAYCTSKGAVGIRINAVCPGDTFVTRWVDRDRERVLEPDEDPATVSDAEVEMRLKISHEIPMHRVGEVKEIASAVLFLASDESSFMTGVALPVDGGT